MMKLVLLVLLAMLSSVVVLGQLEESAPRRSLRKSHKKVHHVKKAHVTKAPAPHSNIVPAPPSIRSVSTLAPSVAHPPSLSTQAPSVNVNGGIDWLCYNGWFVAYFMRINRQL